MLDNEPVRFVKTDRKYGDKAVLKHVETGLHVLDRGSVYASHWWLLCLKAKPTPEQTFKIASALDGGHLFGSHLDVVNEAKGLYKVFGHFD